MNDLAIDADVSLYNALFEVNFAPIFITVTGFVARVDIIGGNKDNSGAGVICLQLTNEPAPFTQELEHVTEWLYADNELWQGFLAGKMIETRKGVIE